MREEEREATTVRDDGWLRRGDYDPRGREREGEKSGGESCECINEIAGEKEREKERVSTLSPSFDFSFSSCPLY